MCKHTYAPNLGPVVQFDCVPLIFFPLHLSTLSPSQKYSGSEKRGPRSSFKLSRKIPFIKKRETSPADGGDDSKRKCTAIVYLYELVWTTRQCYYYGDC